MPCWKKITLLKHNVAAILNRNGHPKGFCPIVSNEPNGEPAIKCQICHKTLATRQDILEPEVFAHVGNGHTRHYCLDCAASLWL